MAEFLKLAFELISQIFYNLVEWIVNFFNGFVKVFFTGVPVYRDIFNSYFKEMSFFGKILAIFLAILLVLIPIAIIVLIVRRIILNIRLKASADDNVTL